MKSGERWLRFDEEIFRLEPIAYRRCQKQKDKEDGQGQRYLVIALTCARCDGNRQYQHKRDKGYGHYRQSGSAQWALLFRFAHRH